MPDDVPAMGAAVRVLHGPVIRVRSRTRPPEPASSG